MFQPGAARDSRRFNRYSPPACLRRDVTVVRLDLASGCAVLIRLNRSRHSIRIYPDEGAVASGALPQRGNIECCSTRISRHYSHATPAESPGDTSPANCHLCHPLFVPFVPPTFRGWRAAWLQANDRPIRRCCTEKCLSVTWQSTTGADRQTVARLIALDRHRICFRQTAQPPAK